MNVSRRRVVRLLAAVLACSAYACAGGRPAVVVRPPAAGGVQAVLRTAEALMGAPYRDGGAAPGGFDCSGFVWYVFQTHRVSLPRDVRRQWDAGRRVGRRDIQAGDLLFFSTTAPGPTHVTLAVDGRRFIHAPSSRGVVRIESITTPYWSRRFLGARRILD